MPKTVLPAIRALFSIGKPLSEPVSLSWRLVRRDRRPFLLLPEVANMTSSGLELYSAQRPLAKLWRLVLPQVLKTPGANLFRRINIQVDANSEWMRFLGEQTGQPAGQVRTPAIMFSGVSEKTSRLVVLVCDAGGYPDRVIKVGLDTRGRATTEREADLLSRLPARLIGCTGITGRYSNETLSAFATAFFPGKSVTTDIGIEKLFHAWLNAGPPVPIEELVSWQELEFAVKTGGPPQWPIIREALARQTMRSTLFHGDFTPWNVRMTNLENIRAYDWESGNLEGIPGWDWFHFVVQSSILVKRHSPERVVAELEQLVRSPRFQKYAREAEISHLIESLLLAYLVHKQYVVRPRTGGASTRRLFELLWTHWNWNRQNSGQTEFLRLREAKQTARQQVCSAFTHLANLFWEPTLSPGAEPGVLAQLGNHWKAVLGSLFWFAGAATLPHLTNPHMLFTPFHLLPSIYLALKACRRLASLMAYVAAIMVPVLAFWYTPAVFPPHVLCWNVVMRIFVFKLVVILLDNVRKQSAHQPPRKPLAKPNALNAISGNWAVIVISILFLTAVVVADALTNPDLLFLPAYLVPCISLTLAMNWRWGTATAALSAVGPLVSFSTASHLPPGIQLWNTGVRFIIFEMVVLLLERVRRQNILFTTMPDRTEEEKEVSIA